MNREIIRVEPLSTYLENWKAPTSAVTKHGAQVQCLLHFGRSVPHGQCRLRPIFPD
jgi:hypothetical protein